MSNEYFSLTTIVTRLTTAKASAINTMAAALAAAFDKLPAPAALANNTVTFAQDSGSPNAIQVSLPLVTAYVTGLKVRVRMAATNTGPTTIQVNALGPRAVVRSSGTNINAADLLIGTVHELAYNGTQFELLTAVQSDVNEAQEAATAAAASALAASNSAADAEQFADAAQAAAAGASGAVSAAVGVTVQAYDADLQGIAGQTYATNEVPYRGASGWAKFTVSSFMRSVLVAVDAAAARLALGLGSVATESTVPISKGGTGGGNAGTARTNLGLGALATLNSVGSAQIDSQAVDAARLVTTERMTPGNVLAAMASLTTGAVGSFAMLARITTGSQIAVNTVYAGSDLIYYGVWGTSSAVTGPALLGASPPGSWRALGDVQGSAPGGSPRAATLFVRVA